MTSRMTTGTGDEQALIERHVALDPQRPIWSEARLVGAGVNVWALVAYRDANDLDLAGVADAYDVPVAAVEAAFAFYRRHRREIDERIAANEWIER